jgi:hypothetical protein
MNRKHTPAGNLASAGLWVARSGLVANLLWIGALKFEDYEVENIEPRDCMASLARRGSRGSSGSPRSP